MIHKLPHWVITHKHPAFYDSESATSIEQTAKLYRAYQDLVEDYNIFVDKINVHIEEYEASTDRKIEVFETAMRQEFQDFIDIINLKYADQENRYEEMMAEFQFKMDQVTSEIDAFIAEKKAELDDHATMKTLAFDSHALNKTREFDENYSAKKSELEAYCDDQAERFNVTVLIDQYNQNASDQTAAFDEHVSTTQTELDAYLEEQKGQLSVDSLIEEYNENAATKTAEFETLVSDSTTAFNNNAVDQKAQFNGAVTTKTTAFNANVETQTATFNENAETQTAAYDANHEEKLTIYNENHDAKMAELNGFESESAFKSLILSTFFRVGSYFETSATPTQFNPNLDWGGTWELDTGGLVTVGVDLNSETYNAVGLTGGEETHKLTTDEMPKHRHTLTMAKSVDESAGYGLTTNGAFTDRVWTTSTTARNTSYQGSGAAHNNMQPYITVYRWHRTA